MGKDLPYWALAEPLPDSYIFALLGRAIPTEDLTRPLGGRMRPRLDIPAAEMEETPIRSPRQPDQLNPKDQHDDFDTSTLNSAMHDDRPAWQKKLYPPKAVVCRDLNVLKEKAVNTRAEAKIEEFVSAFVKWNKDQKADFNAPGFRRIRMDLPQDKIDDLFRDPAHRDYAEPIIELLKKQENGELAIIVSILTCSDMSKGTSTATEHGGGASVGLPDGAAAAVPVEARLGAQTSATTHESLSGTYVGEVVVALRYLRLMLRRPADEKKGFAGWMDRAWSWLRGQRVAEYRERDLVQVSPEFLSPEYGSLYLPQKGIKGNMPVLMGRAARRTLTDLTAHQTLQPSKSMVLEKSDDLDFAIV